MRVGILGSGLMGGKLGTLFARVGHEVVFSYARRREKLRKLAKDAKGKAREGTPREAVQDADALLLAVHWSRIDDALSEAGDLTGKMIVSCSLPMNADDTGPVVAHASSGADISRVQARPSAGNSRRTRSSSLAKACLIWREPKPSCSGGLAGGPPDSRQRRITRRA